MSGSTSRNISIRLSVEGAEIVRRALQQTGEQGRDALQRLDQATQQAASRMAGLQTATTQAAAGGRNFGVVIQQAGFQVGDFASQVASGGNAMTALIQQGSQFLGVFGVGGAIAGAALAVGGIVSQFLLLRGASEGAETGINGATEAIRRLTAQEAAIARVGAALRALNATADQRRAAEFIEPRARGIDELLPLIGQRQAQIAAEEEQIAVLRRRRAAVEADVARARDALATDPTAAAGAFGSAALDGAAQRATLDAEIARREAAAERLRTNVDDLQRQVDLARQGIRDFSRREVVGAFSDDAFQPVTEGAPATPARAGGGRAAAAVREVNPALREAERLFAETRTAAERYEATLTRLGELAPVLRELYGEEGANQIIDRAAQNALTTFERAQALTQQVQDDAQQTREIVRGIGGAFADAFEAAIVKGAEFTDVLNSLQRQLLQVGTTVFVTRPFERALEGIFSGSGGGGGLLGGLFGGGGGGGGLFGGIGSLFTSVLGSIFHSGGTVGEPAPMRALPVAAWANAPRYHSGGWAGLGPDEVPAILQRGERVLSRDEVRRGMAGGVNVTIVAPAPETFNASRSLIEARMARAVRMGTRNL